MFPSCVLPVSLNRHNSAADWSRNRNEVKDRIQRWVDNDIISLWSEAMSSVPVGAESSPEAARLGRCKQAMEDGQYSKAAVLLTSSGLIPPSLKRHMMKCCLNIHNTHALA